MNPFKHIKIIANTKIFSISILGIFNLLLFFFCSCSSENPLERKNYHSSLKGEYIYRRHDDALTPLETPKLAKTEAYPWDHGNSTQYPKITKEYFRCKGSSLNNPHLVQKESKEAERYFDCGGAQRHSLPLQEGKEFVYPILIDILNHIQSKIEKKVVITSGHRCPEHNAYVDSSTKNQYSKHTIGAEVSFYVQGLENQPDKIVEIVMEYFKTTPKYKDKKEFIEFKRYDKDDTDVSTPPWLNKEIFVKLYKKNEGRNYDNRHPYPYLSIQVRCDYETQEKVIYTWEKAFRNYHRW